MNQEHYKLTAMVFKGTFLDLGKSSATEFEEVSTMLSIKKKDLKQKGLGNKSNGAQPVETEDIEKMWSPVQWNNFRQRNKRI